MKKIIALVSFIFLGSLAFAQSGMDVSLGFQYGLANIIDDGETLREIKQPGLLFSFRMVPQTAGFFGRLGLLFPSRVTEGDLTLSYSDYDYILFFNGGLGGSFKAPLGERIAFIFDAGISINDLLYGGSYRDTIDASWKIKLENMGNPVVITGGRKFENVKMKETYNDVAVGLLGNAAFRFNFSQSAYLELGVAAGFDFLRFRSYKFSADLSDYSPAVIKEVFPADMLNDPDNPTEVILETNGKFNVFKQFTFIPSVSIGYSF